MVHIIPLNATLCQLKQSQYTAINDIGFQRNQLLVCTKIIKFYNYVQKILISKPY